MRNEWPLWEIFIRGQHGMSAPPRGQPARTLMRNMAIKNARDVYTRRNEGRQHLGRCEARYIAATVPCLTRGRIV